MGTINYKTSDYITVGYNCDYDYSELENDFTSPDEMNDYLYMCCQDDFQTIENELKKHFFTYYHITIEPGYYDGFSIMIENNYSYCFGSYTDKLNALKEITEIKQFLIKCVNYGLCVCVPGWGTTYYNYNDSIKAIKNAIHEMRTECRNTPTYYKLKIIGED